MLARVAFFTGRASQQPPPRSSRQSKNVSRRIARIEVTSQATAAIENEAADTLHPLQFQMGRYRKSWSVHQRPKQRKPFKPVIVQKVTGNPHTVSCCANERPPS